MISPPAVSPAGGCFCWGSLGTGKTTIATQFLIASGHER